MKRLEELNEGEHYILFLKEKELKNGRYEFLIECNGCDIFDFIFGYDRSCICWTCFEDKAWYVGLNQGNREEIK